MRAWQPLGVQPTDWGARVSPCLQYLIPLIRMSYAHDHKLSLTASTQLLDLADMLGMVVTITYTIAMWL